MSESSQIIRTGGGAFDPAEGHVYFLASNISSIRLTDDVSDYILVAVNELKSGKDLHEFEGMIGEGKKILLDSGIYNLAMEHARTHGTSHNEALNLAPESIDGFDALFDLYVSIVTTFGDRLWGYIELDQGGRENKKRIRARLEAIGLRPVPVYHPFGDGWDYFDELAQGYDRICLGNIVRANPATRLRLVSTIVERSRAYPGLWVHTLGFTPNEVMHAVPTQSADSSSWLAAVRWINDTERCAGATIGPLVHGFKYVIGAPVEGDNGQNKATKLAAYIATHGMANWRQHVEEWT